MNRGSIFVLQITREICQQLVIKLQPSTAYHLRTDGQSEISNKAFKKLLQHYVNYHQDSWEPLLAMAEFAYNNNTHKLTGVSQFMSNYGYNPNFGEIPSTDHCLPSVEQQLKQITEAQDEIKECLVLAQESMKQQFNKHVQPTPDWNIGDKVWLSSQNISIKHPSPKLRHLWLGPFPIASKISKSAYKLTLPLSMQGIHLVFHMSLLRKHEPDTIDSRRAPATNPVQVEGKEGWEVEAILDC